MTNPYNAWDPDDRNQISHPFEPGRNIQACQVMITRRPLFFRATVLRPVLHLADLYIGVCDGERRARRFFAHPNWQDAQSEAALIMHYRATLEPENIYANLPSFSHPMRGR